MVPLRLLYWLLVLSPLSSDGTSTSLRAESLSRAAGAYLHPVPEVSKTIVTTVYDSTLSSRNHIHGLVCQMSRLGLKLLIYVLGENPQLSDNSTAISISYPVDSLARYVTKHRSNRRERNAKEDLWHVDFSSVRNIPSRRKSRC